jgi:hypothetical protein
MDDKVEAFESADGREQFQGPGRGADRSVRAESLLRQGQTLRGQTSSRRDPIALMLERPSSLESSLRSVKECGN